MKSSCSKRGFTLVELSIVLVILGLLVGGVLAGQSLIRAAELRSVTTQYNQYIAAVHSFRDKYFALPGDMTNAQSFWGVAHATPATCKTTASTTALTCNGDGNGQVVFWTTSSNESFRFWQHLANAGLIEGSYSGISQSGANDYTATAANSPAGKISTSYWFPWWIGPVSGSSYWFDGNYGNTLQFGGILANNNPATGVLKPEEAWNIDSKLDDGKPATGKAMIRTMTALTECADSAVSSNTAANYALNATNLGCALIFRQAY